MGLQIAEAGKFNRQCELAPDAASHRLRASRVSSLEEDPRNSAPSSDPSLPRPRKEKATGLARRPKSVPSMHVLPL